MILPPTVVRQQDHRDCVRQALEQCEPAALEAALTAVPAEVVSSGIAVGTPQQISRRLKEYGEVGLRHVVLAPLSSYLSLRDTAYTGAAVRRIAHLLRA